jgi:hypothetical protein
MPRLRASGTLLENIMTKPDASKQHKPGSGVDDPKFYGEARLCWNCELSYKSMEDAPSSLPLWFCSPLCQCEWMSSQPLQNLLDKRRMRRKRDK